MHEIKILTKSEGLVAVELSLQQLEITRLSGRTKKIVIVVAGEVTHVLDFFLTVRDLSSSPILDVALQIR